MVAAISTPKTSSRDEPFSQSNPRRPPLLPSEKDNNGSNNNNSNNNNRRPKARVVASRYMTPSPSTPSSNSSSSVPSRRFPSPVVSRNSTPLTNTRSVSVDRRRSSVSRPLDLNVSNGNQNSVSVSAATKLLVTSTRSLSVSFQGESFSLPISKTKVAPPSPNLRKSTPERRRTGGGDQHRWPARSRRPPNQLSMSLDCRGTDRGSGNGSVIQSRVSVDNRLNPNLGNAKNLVNNESDFTLSDTDSISSGSNSGGQECGGGNFHSQTDPMVDPPMVSARFWQETNSRLRRLQDSGSGSKLGLKKYPSDVLPMSSPPIRGAIRPSSPSKVPSRGMLSPSRVRNAVSSTITNSFHEAPSVLSFAVDVRRGKVGENRIVDAHLLRLLYNRHLQWRFVNARTESSLIMQTHSAEKDLWNSWIKISDLRDIVTKRRHRLQLLRQKLKLASILKGQISYLEDWGLLDKEHCVSVLGAIESLKANTLRLPVVAGAIVDVPSLKEAIGSAVDVMKAMGSSICSLLAMVEEVNSWVTELTKTATKERALLEECKDFLSMLAIMQVKDCSLRTHVLQHNHIPTA